MTADDFTQWSGISRDLALTARRNEKSDFLRDYMAMAHTSSAPSEVQGQLSSTRTSTHGAAVHVRAADVPNPRQRTQPTATGTTSVRSPCLVDG
ncbi:hypothetical protein C8034_v010095 [Colletotrichum sidae]|uniref:Uncharacterized protein n=1 Tax=Colletotrichum sidae TaxID=1347389 RepID=A0A4R8T1E9_9PEZI|nr:hypothetical protein C8034_v010095 [Colletotrichum sidae]